MKLNPYRLYSRYPIRRFQCFFSSIRSQRGLVVCWACFALDTHSSMNSFHSHTHYAFSASSLLRFSTALTTWHYAKLVPTFLSAHSVDRPLLKRKISLSFVKHCLLGLTKRINTHFFQKEEYANSSCIYLWWLDSRGDVCPFYANTTNFAKFLSFDLD